MLSPKMDMREANIVNWAVALSRAKTPAKAAHAVNQLMRAVDVQQEALRMMALDRARIAKKKKASKKR